MENIKIRQKGKLAEVIFSLGFDALVFERDGSWYLLSSNFASSGEDEKLYIIYKYAVYYKCSTKKSVKELMKLIETNINDYDNFMDGYFYAL